MCPHAHSPTLDAFEFHLWWPLPGNQLLGWEWGTEGKDPQGPLGVGSELPRPSHLPLQFPLPLPPICFLQFVKSVIIFLGAFLLFFKCKIYLYSVFKVVKKITTKSNQMNLPEFCLLASCVAITLSALAGFADSLLHVPLTPGGSGAHSCTHTHTHTLTHAHTCVRTHVGPLL